jgi:hypothetical protein
MNGRTAIERPSRVPLKVGSKLTYQARNSVSYLLKRAHSLMLDVMEPVLEKQHGFTSTQYVILSWLRDSIALNPKDISVELRHNSGALTRVIDQLAERGLKYATPYPDPHLRDRPRTPLRKRASTVPPADDRKLRSPRRSQYAIPIDGHQSRRSHLSGADRIHRGLDRALSGCARNHGGSLPVGCHRVGPRNRRASASHLDE